MNNNFALEIFCQQFSFLAGTVQYALKNGKPLMQSEYGRSTLLLALNSHKSIFDGEL